MGLLLLGLSRAPGWRGVRVFAFIALTASAYSAANIFFALPGFSDSAVLAASRWNYLAGSLHCAAWLLYTFGGQSPSWSRVNRPLKALAIALAAGGAFIFLTGLHYIPGVWANTTISWAHVSYRSPTLRPWAEWYGLLMVGSLLVPFFSYVQRTRRREAGAATHLIGFSIFFVCSVIELLAANRVVDTVYMADIGFLAVVLPVAIATVQRVVQDAARLDDLSRQLTDEVATRTQQLDRAQDALVESERHAALGRLAAGIGHEINNPLTYLGLSLDTVDEWAAYARIPGDVRDALLNARDGAHRIREVVSSLRDYTRTHTGTMESVDLSDIATTAMRVAAHQMHHVARIETELRNATPARGDEARLVQVVVNLLTNASQAITDLPHGRDACITIRTRVIDNTWAVLEVVDTGGGIAPDKLHLVTEPYFTTRAESGGTGLGLYLARGIVEQHEGQLEITSTLGVGTAARILLPLARKTVALQRTPALTPPFSELIATGRPRPTVLIVDDEPILAKGLARALSAYCEVEVANSGTEAISRLKTPGTSIDAIVCDVMMPEMSGVEFAEVLADAHPQLRERTLFMTGGAVTASAGEFLDRPDVRYVNKPISALELADEISRLIVTA